MSSLVIDRPAADDRRQFFAEDCEPVRVELRQHFQRLREVLESRPLAAGNVRSIVLGGSYGRGEGGLLLRPDGSRSLYNDLDYFAFCHRKRPGTDEVLREIEKRESHHLGIDVEFTCLTGSDSGN
ncbi:MAG: hypothetical protein R3F19_14775 [Verrucomicrobiales bacterium]